MIPYPSIEPEIVHVGPLVIRWYGVMYLIGFAASYFLVKKQIKKRGLRFSSDFIESLYTYIILGLVIGARLGYVLFYDLSAYLAHPLEIFAVWHGGMSFHGGLIGSIVLRSMVLQAVPCGHLASRRPRVRYRADRPRYGQAWKLHQWRTLRPRHGHAMGHDLSNWRVASPTPVTAL